MVSDKKIPYTDFYVLFEKFLIPSCDYRDSTEYAIIVAINKLIVLSIDFLHSNMYA
jgi:hypothetical protein